MKNPKRTLSIAPMMDWTDRHFRYFVRLITKETLLYSEMVTALAVIHGHRDYLLDFSPCEQPLALQLGGSDPKVLAQAAKIGEQYGYVEINLNVGCPSNRVQAGRFGACLMKEPDLVADCVAAMQQVVSVPVTVKTRLGVDDADSYDLLCHFIQTVHQAGCQTFIMHARKAWLQGLSPRENREVPPLCYDTVYRLKQEYPDLEIILNGGVKTCAAISQHLQHVDGVMLGREAYANPYLLAPVDAHFFGSESVCGSQQDIVHAYCDYVDQQLSQGVPLHSLVRHILGLFKGNPGARLWRRYLSEWGNRTELGSAVLVNALRCMTDI